MEFGCKMGSRILEMDYSKGLGCMMGCKKGCCTLETGCNLGLGYMMGCCILEMGYRLRCMMGYTRGYMMGCRTWKMDGM